MQLLCLQGISSIRHLLINDLFLDVANAGSYRSAINSTKAWASNLTTAGEILASLQLSLEVI